MTRISVISTAAVMTVAMLLPTPSLAQLNGSHTPIERMNPAIAGKINKVTLEVK